MTDYQRYQYKFPIDDSISPEKGYFYYNYAKREYYNWACEPRQTTKDLKNFVCELDTTQLDRNNKEFGANLKKKDECSKQLIIENQKVIKCKTSLNQFAPAKQVCIDKQKKADAALQ